MDDVKNLSEILSGVGGFSILALLTFCGKVLRGDDRSAGNAWAVIGAGLVCGVVSLLFVAVSSGRVFASWTASGPVDGRLVVLTISWVFAVVVLLTTALFAKRACQHLVECYHPDDDPSVVRVLRRLLVAPSSAD